MADAALRSGDRIGAYTVDAPLGEGSFGSVYTVSGPAGDRVALKIEPKGVPRPLLPTEARVYALLKGKEGFPKVHAFFEAPTTGAQCLVMDRLGEFVTFHPEVKDVTENDFGSKTQALSANDRAIGKTATETQRIDTLANPPHCSS